MSRRARTLRTIKVVSKAAVAALLFVTTSLGCGQGSEQTNTTQSGLGEPSVRSQLRTLALQASSATGVASPKTMIAVASADHQAAEKVVSGDIVNDHVPVYVIEMTGGPFTDNNASVPPGAAPPTGTVLTLTVDAQSFRVTDFGLTNSAPDLTQIGPVVDLSKS